jgi:hypothetical protein
MVLQLWLEEVVEVAGSAEMVVMRLVQDARDVGEMVQEEHQVLPEQEVQDMQVQQQPHVHLHVEVTVVYLLIVDFMDLVQLEARGMALTNKMVQMAVQDMWKFHL